MKTYVGTIQSKEKKKSYIIGESHLNKIRKDKFKGSTPKFRVYVKSFSGANTNQLDYYIVPNDFSYICNALVNENYLWRDGLDLTNEGSSLLLKNFINYLNGNGNNSI